jgi:hypothetical protein
MRWWGLNLDNDNRLIGGVDSVPAAGVINDAFRNKPLFTPAAERAMTRWYSYFNCLEDHKTMMAVLSENAYFYPARPIVENSAPGVWTTSGCWWTADPDGTLVWNGGPPGANRTEAQDEVDVLEGISKNMLMCTTPSGTMCEPLGNFWNESNHAKYTIPPTHAIPSANWKVYCGMAAQWYSPLNKVPMDSKWTDGFSLRVYAREVADEISASTDCWFMQAGVASYPLSAYVGEPNSDNYTTQIHTWWNSQLMKLWDGNSLTRLDAANNVDWDAQTTIQYFYQTDYIFSETWKRAAFGRVTADHFTRSYGEELEVKDSVRSLAKWFEGTASNQIVGNTSLSMYFNIEPSTLLEKECFIQFMKLSQSFQARSELTFYGYDGWSYGYKGIEQVQGLAYPFFYPGNSLHAIQAYSTVPNLELDYICTAPFNMPVMAKHQNNTQDATIFSTDMQLSQSEQVDIRQLVRQRSTVEPRGALNWSKNGKGIGLSFLFRE